VPGWVSHLGLMWEDAEHRRFVEALSREHRHPVRQARLRPVRPVASAYAVTHPEVLSSLIVYGSCVRGRDLAPD
jgi:hypothetical protein